jgi:excisionase family DNA binding protein
MKPNENRRLAEGRSNGGADLERSHSINTVPQPHTALSMPSAEGADAGTCTSRLLYTVSDAAWMLSLSRAHLYREIQRGTLPSVLVGGRCRRISRVALEQYIAHLEESNCLEGQVASDVGCHGVRSRRTA